MSFRWLTSLLHAFRFCAVNLVVIVRFFRTIFMLCLWEYGFRLVVFDHSIVYYAVQNHFNAADTEIMKKKKNDAIISSTATPTTTTKEIKNKHKLNVQTTNENITICCFSAAMAQAICEEKVSNIVRHAVPFSCSHIAFGFIDTLILVFPLYRLLCCTNMYTHSSIHSYIVTELHVYYYIYFWFVSIRTFSCNRRCIPFHRWLDRDFNICIQYKMYKM